MAAFWKAFRSRKPAAETAQQELEAEEQPRGGTNPVLIATFIVLAALGGVIAWLALSSPSAPPAAVSLSLGETETILDLSDGQISLGGALTPQATDKRDVSEAEHNRAQSSLRVLPAMRTTDGRLQLGPVPDPALVQQSVVGPLPKIAEDGAQSWHVYAHPFDSSDPRPKVAIIIGGMGLSRATTSAALKDLPPAISLAYTPYVQRLQDWIDQSRAYGHEVLLELPMEPHDFPENDPGPYALLTELSVEENTSRLEWLLSRFTGYVGVVNFLGAKFLTAEVALAPVIAELKGRGLMMIDDSGSRRSMIAGLAGQIDMPFIVSDRRIDVEPDAAYIGRQLAELEAVAIDRGFAVGVGSPYPVTVETLKTWAAGLAQRGIVLVPVSAGVR